MTPHRLQLSRRKGFRLPLGSRSVARPSKFGNPFQVWENRGWFADTFDPALGCMGLAVLCRGGREQARGVAVDAYRAAIDAQWRAVPTVDLIRAELAGLSLACWCLLPEPGQPDICHAAVLIALANPTQEEM